MVVLSKIYTKTGDAGETALGNGARVAKHATRVAAYGTVDETNATVGLAPARFVVLLFMPHPLYVAFIWHQHQPLYKSVFESDYRLPWVRLHGTKDYLDLVLLLDRKSVV